MPPQDPQKEQIWHQIALEMQLALHSGKHEFHHFYFVTASDNIPSARTVIMRDFNSCQRSIMFHSDIRSNKCLHLATNHNVMALFYSMQLKMQIRFSGTAKVHSNDDLARQRWEQSPTLCKRTYLKNHAPGKILSNLDQLAPENFHTQILTQQDEKLAFDNFSVIKIIFSSMEVLELNFRGNQAAKINWQPDNSMLSEHIAP